VWIINSINGALTIFTMLMVGFFLCKAKVVDETGELFISKLLTYAIVPVMTFESIYKTFTPDLIKEMGWSLLIPTLILGVGFLLFVIGAYALKLPVGERGVSAGMAGFGNIMYIGLPLCLMIFGEEARAYVTSFYVSSMVIYFIFAEILIAVDVGKKVDMRKTVIKKLFSPIMVCLMLGMLVGILQIPIPTFLKSAIGYVGGATLPLVLILTGVMFANMGKEVIRMTKSSVFILIGRLVICPALTLITCLLFKVDPVTSSVYTAVAAMPSVNQPVVTAKFYGANAELAVRIVVLTNLLCIGVIPLVVTIVSHLYGVGL